MKRKRVAPLCAVSSYVDHDSSAKWLFSWLGLTFGRICGRFSDPGDEGSIRGGVGGVGSVGGVGGDGGGNPRWGKSIQKGRESRRQWPDPGINCVWRPPTASAAAWPTWTDAQVRPHVTPWVVGEIRILSRDSSFGIISLTRWRGSCRHLELSYRRCKVAIRGCRPCNLDVCNISNKPINIEHITHLVRSRWQWQRGRDKYFPRNDKTSCAVFSKTCSEVLSLFPKYFMFMLSW